MIEILLQKDMTNEERMMFQAEYNRGRKDTTVAVLLAIFLGGIGAHHFYLSKIGLGVLYLVFCWTFIPSVIAVIECFIMKSRISNYNDDLAREIANKIKILNS